MDQAALAQRGAHAARRHTIAFAAQIGGHLAPPIHAPRVPIVARSASVSRASVTVRAEGAAVFRLRYVHGATATPCSVSTRQIDSTRNPQARIWSINPQISGGAGQAPGGEESRGRLQISLATFRSRTSRSSSLIRCCSALMAPGRWLAPTWACKTHRRNDSQPTPTFGPITWHAASTYRYSSR